jgi:membrane-bound serine protease (ClpP class)
MGLPELATFVYQVLTNPNVTFLLLVIGLWSAVFAVFVPGTGIPEAGAAICLALAAVGLLGLPVNLVGLLLIVLGMALSVIEIKFPAHGALLLSGALAIGLGALFLFRVGDASSARISWPTVVSVPLVSALLFGFLISKGLAAQRAPALQDLHRLIGAHGVTRTPVARDGTVYVDGEDWSATAEAPIPPDTDVVVVERRGLMLKVAAAAPASKAPAK